MSPTGTQLVSTSSPPHFLGAASVCCWRETHEVRQEGAGRREDVVLANLPSGGEVGLRGQLVASGPLPAWRCDPGRARAKGVFGLKDVPVSCLKLDQCCFHSDEQGTVFITQPRRLRVKSRVLLLHHIGAIALRTNGWPSLLLAPKAASSALRGKEGQVNE